MNGVDVFGDEVGEGEDFYGGEEAGEELEGGWGGEEAFVKHLWRGIFRGFDCWCWKTLILYPMISIAERKI